VSDAPTVAGKRENLTTVRETIKESSGEDTVADDVRPAFEAFVGSDDTEVFS